LPVNPEGAHRLPRRAASQKKGSTEMAAIKFAGLTQAITVEYIGLNLAAFVGRDGRKRFRNTPGFEASQSHARDACFWALEPHSLGMTPFREGATLWNVSSLNQIAMEPSL
jgi:hypothetical protein